MFCKYLPYNLKKYATNLQFHAASQHLQWESAPGQSVLVTQCLYGEDATRYADEICEKLKNFRLLDGEYAEILPAVWLQYITAEQKARNNGVSIHDKACTYTVLACDRTAEGYCIYEPQVQSMISPICNVTLEMEIEVAKEQKQVGLFKKRMEDTGFYRVQITASPQNAYRTGLLQCELDNLTLPVTSEMLESSFYFKTQRSPKFSTKNKGISLSYK